MAAVASFSVCSCGPAGSSLIFIICLVWQTLECQASDLLMNSYGGLSVGEEHDERVLRSKKKDKGIHEDRPLNLVHTALYATAINP